MGLIRSVTGPAREACGLSLHPNHGKLGCNIKCGDKKNRAGVLVAKTDQDTGPRRFGLTCFAAAVWCSAPLPLPQEGSAGNLAAR